MLEEFELEREDRSSCSRVYFKEHMDSTASLVKSNHRRYARNSSVGSEGSLVSPTLVTNFDFYHEENQRASSVERSTWTSKLQACRLKEPKGDKTEATGVKFINEVEQVTRNQSFNFRNYSVLSFGSNRELQVIYENIA